MATWKTHRLRLYENCILILLEKSKMVGSPQLVEAFWSRSGREARTSPVEKVSTQGYLVRTSDKVGKLGIAGRHDSAGQVCQGPPKPEASAER